MNISVSLDTRSCDEVLDRLKIRIIYEGFHKTPKNNNKKFYQKENLNIYWVVLAVSFLRNHRQNKNSVTILYFWNIFSTVNNLEIEATHVGGPELYSIPLSGLQCDLPPPGGVHWAGAGVCAVICLLQSLTIEVQPGCVTLATVRQGPQAECHPPGSRHRHSEYPWNVTIIIRYFNLYLKS